MPINQKKQIRLDPAVQNRLKRIAYEVKFDTSKDTLFADWAASLWGSSGATPQVPPSKSEFDDDGSFENLEGE